MKLTIRINGDVLSAYIRKKDLEEPIISVEDEALWGGSILLGTAGGWPCPTFRRKLACRLPSRQEECPAGLIEVRMKNPIG